MQRQRHVVLVQRNLRNLAPNRALSIDHLLQAGFGADSAAAHDLFVAGRRARDPVAPVVVVPAIAFQAEHPPVTLVVEDHQVAQFFLQLLARQVTRLVALAQDADLALRFLEGRWLRLGCALWHDGSDRLGRRVGWRGRALSGARRLLDHRAGCAIDRLRGARVEDQRARFFRVRWRLGVGLVIGPLKLRVVRGLRPRGFGRLGNRFVHAVEQAPDLRVGRAIPAAGHGRGRAWGIRLGQRAVWRACAFRLRLGGARLGQRGIVRRVPGAGYRCGRRLSGSRGLVPPIERGLPVASGRRRRFVGLPILRITSLCHTPPR